MVEEDDLGMLLQVPAINAAPGEVRQLSRSLPLIYRIPARALRSLDRSAADARAAISCGGRHITAALRRLRIVVLEDLLRHLSFLGVGVKAD